MSVYCLIPAKPHAEAKSRLAPILSTEQRMSLTRWLLRRTLRLARQVVGPVIVVSRDPAIIAQAETQGAWGLPEASAGLNPALTQAAGFAMDHGATGILVLPTDLPRVTASDLETVLSLGNVEGAGFKPTPHPAGLKPALHSTLILVIAPCRHGTGTNALLIRPPDLIPFAFGPGSFAAHCAAARSVGVEPVVYRSNSIAFDLDTPEDWELGIGNQGIRESGSQATRGWRLTTPPIYQPTNLPIYQFPNLPVSQSTSFPIYQPTSFPIYQSSDLLIRFKRGSIISPLHVSRFHVLRFHVSRITLGI